MKDTLEEYFQELSEEPRELLIIKVFEPEEDEPEDWF